MVNVMMKSFSQAVDSEINSVNFASFLSDLIFKLKCAHTFLFSPLPLWHFRNIFSNDTLHTEIT